MRSCCSAAHHAMMQACGEVGSFECSVSLLPVKKYLLGWCSSLEVVYLKIRLVCCHRRKELFGWCNDLHVFSRQSWGTWPMLGCKTLHSCACMWVMPVCQMMNILISLKSRWPCSELALGLRGERTMSYIQLQMFAHGRNRHLYFLDCLITRYFYSIYLANFLFRNTEIRIMGRGKVY